MVDFGARLRLLRQAGEMTQKQLADKLGLTKSVISAYETDSRMPSYDILIRMTAVFGVSVDYLLGVASRQTVDVSGLSDSDRQLVLSLIYRLRADMALEPGARNHSF